MGQVLSERDRYFLVGGVKRRHDHQRRLQLRLGDDVETQGECLQTHKNIRRRRFLPPEEISRRHRNDEALVPVACDSKIVGTSTAVCVTRQGHGARA
jgi:hypothetical protein